MSTVDVEITIQRKQRRNTRQSGQAGKDDVAPRIPRIARLMALAIKFQDMVVRGEVRDYADLARLGYVSRARITQIMNLLNLAPNIQEEILLRQGTSKVITERRVRFVTSEACWKQQRQLWHKMSPAR